MKDLCNSLTQRFALIVAALSLLKFIERDRNEGVDGIHIGPGFHRSSNMLAEFDSEFCDCVVFQGMHKFLKYTTLLEIVTRIEFIDGPIPQEPLTHYVN